MTWNCRLLVLILNFVEFLGGFRLMAAIFLVKLLLKIYVLWIIRVIGQIPKWIVLSILLLLLIFVCYCCFFGQDNRALGDFQNIPVHASRVAISRQLMAVSEKFLAKHSSTLPTGIGRANR